MVAEPYSGQRDLAVPYPDPVPWAVFDFIELREDLPVRFSIQFYLLCSTFRAETQMTGRIDEPWMHPVGKRSHCPASLNDVLYAVKFAGKGINGIKIVGGVLMEHLPGIQPGCRRGPVPYHVKMKGCKERGYQAGVITEQLDAGVPVACIPAPYMVAAE